MALKQCKECQKEVSSKAKKCPHCGTPLKSSGVKWIFLIIFIVWIVATIGERSPSRSAINTTVYEASSAITQTEENTTAMGENWNYDMSEDEMSGKNMYVAQVTSTNTLDFSFPYQGTQHAGLMLRTHPRYGKDIILSIEKGQFYCTSFDGCEVLVRFDDSAPVSFRADEPENRKTTILFINNYSGFVEKMMKAKRVRIQAVFFQQGNSTLEFDVSNFDVKRYKPTE